ncbi:hypothetical protein SD51_07760 [Alicyclobacillus tengchongensis]|nr:hypothetical protein SD51_07760 [Alicyclobacillus tengchongensis]
MNKIPHFLILTLVILFMCMLMTQLMTWILVKVFRRSREDAFRSMKYSMLAVGIFLEIHTIIEVFF